MSFNKTILIIGGDFIAIKLTELLLQLNNRIIVIDVDYKNDAIINEKNNLDFNDIIKKYNVDIIISFKQTEKLIKVSRHIQINSIYEYSDINIVTSMCYGPSQNINEFIPKLINQAILENELIISINEYSRDLIYITDCCDAILKILNFGKLKNYEVCSGFEIKDIEIVRNILKYLKLPLSFVDYMNSFEMMQKLNNKNIIQLGWHPKVKFEDGIINTIKFYQKIK